MNKMMKHILLVAAIAAANFAATYMLLLILMGLGALTEDSLRSSAILFIHGSLLWTLCPLYMLRDSLPAWLSDSVLLPLIVNSILWAVMVYLIVVRVRHGLSTRKVQQD